jgi:uncharacterized protein
VNAVREDERPSFRILPAPTPWSRPFWTGGGSRQLVIYRCRTCQRYSHPPAPACFRCQSVEVGPEAVSGLATVAAFTIARHQWFEGFPVPYVIAIVEIDEDPTVRLTTNVVGCEAETVHIGQRVAVDFEQWDDVWIPVFRPVPS